MKNIQMSHEQATKISTELLNVFRLLFKFTPPHLSTSIENAKTKTITFKILLHNEKGIWAKKRVSYLNEDEYTIKFSHCGKLVKAIKHIKCEYRLDIIYKIIIDNRCFKITLFDDPDDCGYCSMLPEYDDYMFFSLEDSSPYVLCNIVEERPNGQSKYEMAFGFDIEKGTFLELFELVHYTTTDVVREYSDSRLETELKDTEIF